MRLISTTPQTLELLAQGAAVGMGTSGGKDSAVLALALNDYLDGIRHPKEKRCLIHSDLGIIEWPESLEWCEKLAEKTNLELVVVRRAAGGMVERWESRWKANWNRYLNLQCLKVILPWSTPAMRFCTSELKTDIICRELKKRFPTGPILSATGIRAEESPNRAKAPILSEQKKLQRKSHLGWNWNPILQWTLPEVKAYHEENAFPLHPAYTVFGASRVSCSMCILSTARDQLAGLKQPGNHAAYKRLCELEIKSGFAFQRDRWLCDLDPKLRETLIPSSESSLVAAKNLCKKREALESELPKTALFLPGKPWPHAAINRNDAESIARIRTAIFELYGLEKIEDPETVQETINGRIPKESARLTPISQTTQQLPLL